MMSHGIGRAGMTGEIPAAEKVETQDRDGRNDQLGTMGPVEPEESAGKWETRQWMPEGYQTSRNDQWDTSWRCKWRRPTTGLAGMTSRVVEGVSAVGGGGGSPLGPLPPLSPLWPLGSFWPLPPLSPLPPLPPLPFFPLFAMSAQVIVGVPLPFPASLPVGEDEVRRYGCGCAPMGGRSGSPLNMVRGGPKSQKVEGAGGASVGGGEAWREDEDAPSGAGRLEALARAEAGWVVRGLGTGASMAKPSGSGAMWGAGGAGGAFAPLAWAAFSRRACLGWGLRGILNAVLPTRCSARIRLTASWLVVLWERMSSVTCLWEMSLPKKAKRPRGTEDLSLSSRWDKRRAPERSHAHVAASGGAGLTLRWRLPG